MPDLDRTTGPALFEADAQEMSADQLAELSGLLAAKPRPAHLPRHWRKAPQGTSPDAYLARCDGSSSGARAGFWRA